jgi:hypothetical protein
MARFNVTDSAGNKNFIEADEAYVAANYASYEEVIEELHEGFENDNARAWRDQELAETDWIVQTPDHPQRDNYLTYRQKLRDWPATNDDDEYINDFPATRPEIGS